MEHRNKMQVENKTSCKYSKSKKSLKKTKSCLMKPEAHRLQAVGSSPVPKPGTFNKPGTFLGKHHSDESKKRISDSMKTAHAEDRAYTWSHRTTEPSYPEQFLIKVLKNEFNLECGVDYFREVPFHGYFLDFCFTERKIVIEMDGEQHTRFSDQVERDKRKDALLKDEGYTELRIPWKDCFNNPKEWIGKVANLLGFTDYAEVT